MVAVRCSHCGEIHRGDIHRPGDGSVHHARPAPSPGSRGLVVDVPAVLAGPSPCGTSTAVAAQPSMRTSTVYGNSRPARRPPPQALPSGRPNKPLVQIIQEVINRSPTGDLAPGTRVAVRNRFNGRWAPGFAVHEVLETGYRLSREHTGAVLPAVFLRADVAADGHRTPDLLSRRSRRTTPISPRRDANHPRSSTPV